MPKGKTNDGNDSGASARVESAAVSQLRTINTAEVVYLSSHEGKYGTLSDMITAGLLDKRFSEPISGYAFDVKLQQSGTGYLAIATPTDNVGRYSFNSSSDAVIRYSAGPDGTAIGQPVH